LASSRLSIARIADPDSSAGKASPISVTVDAPRS
jgi:hypothetical protein